MTDERPLETGWLPDTPVEDNLLRAFIHNQGRVDGLLAEAKGGRAKHTDDVFLADALSCVPYFNQAIITRPLTGSHDPVLGEVEAFYADAGRPHTLLSVWPSPDLTARGWSLVGHPAVVVRGRGPVPDHAPPDVEIRVVDDPETLAVAERVLIEGFPIEEAAGAPPSSEFPPTVLGTRLTVRLGLLGGEAVAVGLSHVSDGLVNLCGGATLPAARRRGVWESLVWARVSQAPDLAAIAYTSDLSRPGFIRMGFMPIMRFTLWYRPS